MTSSSLRDSLKIQYYPYAKINLGLFITGKRSDGYHLLETLLYPFTALEDELSLTASTADGCSLSIEGIHLTGNPRDNLCVRAYHFLEQRMGKLGGVHIHLKKGIPAGAGLGGGSSDAAFTLKGLNELFSLKLEIAELAQIGAMLGADVPFFLYGKPLLASGIGTELSSIDLNMPYEIRLITPPIHSSTLAAYQALDYKHCVHQHSLAEILKLPIDKWKDLLINDLEVPVFQLYPELKTIKQSFYDQGALYAAMSGSGSAVFGLFE